ncbi:MAG: hypothetical protein OEV93_02265, partial [Candidatus Moranbacteria bacterium]|nr:hypothetical protein [Candidatus Moranbacteria bacterium]
MKTKQQNKKYFKIFFLLVIIFFGSAFFISQITSAQSSSKRIDVSGYVLDKKNEPVPDGEYSMTFTIYSGG